MVYKAVELGAQHLVWHGMVRSLAVLQVTGPYTDRHWSLLVSVVSELLIVGNQRSLFGQGLHRHSPYLRDE